MNRFCLSRCQDALRIQLFGNLSAGLSVDNTQKNSAYHRGGSFVYDKLMLVILMRFIAIRDGIHEPCLLLLRSHCRLNLLRKILAVIVIDQVFEGNIHPDSLAFMRCTVIMVIDGLEADAEEREDMLQVIANLKIVSSKAREVFHNNAANLTALCAFNHPLKIRTVKIGAGKSVIAELNPRKIAKHRCLIQMTVDKQTLRSDAVAVIFYGVCPLIHIFQGQSEIDSNLIFHHATSFLSLSQVLVSASNSSM